MSQDSSKGHQFLTPTVGSSSKNRGMVQRAKRPSNLKPMVKVHRTIHRNKLGLLLFKTFPGVSATRAGTEAEACVRETRFLAVYLGFTCAICQSPLCFAAG